jgi:hypothetical protein
MLQFKGSFLLFFAILILVFAGATGTSRAQNELVATGAYWTYWDWGFEPDPDWEQPNYEDFEWSFGPSPFGFGVPGVATGVQSFITTAYFRHYFFSDPIPEGPVTLRVRRDDGVIVYLNGVEVFRDNMPPGEVDSETPALNDVEPDSYLEVTIDNPSLFVAGYNVIAAEVHQSDIFSPDFFFDLQLVDTNASRRVAITSPADNAIIATGSDVIITATAEPVSEVFLVAFYEGSNLLGADSEPPYEGVLPASSASNYVLRAEAIYNDSTSRTSAPVNISVVGEAPVVRGPYLQLGTPTSVIVRWRTSAGTDSVVRYGATENNLDQSTRVSMLTTEHEVQLSGLSPDTKYYYSIGSSSATQAGGPDYFFVTSPAGPKPTRIWVIGDAGGAGTIPPDFGSHLVRDAYYSYAGTRYTDVWLMLGDNAYDLGRDEEYQRGMFDVFPNLLRQTAAWSTIGNHEYFTDVYLNIFSLPKNGEAGGVPSGVENYYSFNYGDIHFVCLAGYYSGSRLSNGVMCTWLKADLEANTNKWLIAFWHQPPYTKGSHDSDFEPDHVEMRENAVPILESHGVDLILSGHSHVYERSHLMHGHYGYSWEIEPEMFLGAGSGRVDDGGPYVKQAEGNNANHGTVYVVAGSSSWTRNCCHGLNHPAMYKSLAERGSLVVDIEGDTLNGTFLRENGRIDDYFTIVKAGTVLRIVNITIEDGLATLWWTSTPGLRYQVEFTSNLAAAWAPVDEVIQASGSLTTASVAMGTNRQGFYRVQQVD